MAKPTAFLFFGKSGSGKGTQAKLLQEYLGRTDPDRTVLTVSTGARFREFGKTDSYTSDRVSEILHAGAILPVFLSVWMWTGWLIENFTGDEHVVIDGLARQEHEASVLAEALEFYGLTPAHIFLLDVSDEEVSKRLLDRKRVDDTPELIKQRLSWFHTHVTGSLEVFKKDDRVHFHTVDGSKEAAETHRDIVAILEKSA